jgi:hypothetical protein
MRCRPALARNQIQARDGSIRTAIGRMLAAQYDLAEPLSAPLVALLRRLEQTPAIGADGTPRTTGSASLAGAGAKPELAST